MKKLKGFASGFLAGAVVCSCVGIAAVTYTAVPVDFKVLVNGEEFVSDPPALAVDGRTYLSAQSDGRGSRRSGELE